MTTLLIIGRHDGDPDFPDDDLDAVTDQVVPRAHFLTERCREPWQVVEIVRAAASEHGPIDILDLYDHGKAGGLYMGNEMLFSSDDSPTSALDGFDIALAIREYLSDTAHVRLLGCTTASAAGGLESRLLLLKLARILGGHRVVHGTIVPIHASDFSPWGFKAAFESTRLFSHLGALDADAPLGCIRATSVLQLVPDWDQ